MRVCKEADEGFQKAVKEASAMVEKAEATLKRAQDTLKAEKEKTDAAVKEAELLEAYCLFCDPCPRQVKSPICFVLHLRELECVQFYAPVSVLMALFSGRLGFSGPGGDAFPAELERGSSNTNMSADFCWHYPARYDCRLLHL
ncbi:hypothetical protein PF005_g3493 [Phytophthora fragariae]|uniref:Uncharacterized protein n=1 Tax=Phytophthora fragariae TaxID=53985 RepID=A0A6A3Z773_9STRA|nr:hypothetical protein PF009_g3838 [Phytophthora fragariae]KAE9133367.1 hypothetical protein PF007_g3388 [Phytophthora fragariae]KAE9230402.1 hypothetical protein PF005_g3493 [Phytophthora fragariae]KAE9325057.1 hypothetical protein PF001_g3127 [Phytophthora fragariae]